MEEENEKALQISKNSEPKVLTTPTEVVSDPGQPLKDAAQDSTAGIASICLSINFVIFFLLDQQRKSDTLRDSPRGHAYPTRPPLKVIQIQMMLHLRRDHH